MHPSWGITILVFIVTLFGAPFFWEWIGKITGFDEI